MVEFKALSALFCVSSCDNKSLVFVNIGFLQLVQQKRLVFIEIFYELLVYIVALNAKSHFLICVVFDSRCCFVTASVTKHLTAQATMVSPESPGELSEARAAAVSLTVGYPFFILRLH